ncbi:MAG: hypothetical protein NVS9B15_20020 [Acidobacteriaceae bacterium]
MRFSPRFYAAVAALLITAVTAQAQQGIEIPAGTKVSCRLEQTISSATAEQGQQVQLSTTEDVKVGDAVVIPQNSAVLGTIVQAQEKRRMGRTGKLDFSIDKVRAADGEFIPLRYTLNKREGGSSATSTGVMTAGAAVLFWPAAPFFLLRQGKDVTINKGIVLETFTDQAHVMKSMPRAAAATASGTPSSSEMTQVTISANVTGADVEIDGNYVGSTPITRPLPAGTHKITVKAEGKFWERMLSVSGGGSTTVSATIKK